MIPENQPIRLTQFAHGAGCGCKISPNDLREMLQGLRKSTVGELLVGNAENDDAAAWNLGDGRALISTTDFFMPIVDSPSDFGAIAAANAISDVYAMGGKPFMALAILGWPIGKIPASVAAEVMQGASEICAKAGVVLAGGHTIDSPEPIFGLSVNGFCDIVHLKRNNTAKVGDYLYLSKPLGTGILSTAAKRGTLFHPADAEPAIESMKKLNTSGFAVGKIEAVHAMTDITGFGLAGHLLEMLSGSGCSAEINMQAIPVFETLKPYVDAFVYPDMTMRNYNNIKADCSELDGTALLTLCDPQTSGGLLISVAESGKNAVEEILRQAGEYDQPIGRLIPIADKAIFVG
jgi:selenide,water dikinase